MGEDLGQRAMTRGKRRLTWVLLAVLASVLAFLALRLLAPERVALQANPFVGTWELTPPDEPGLRKFLTLDANGRFSVRTVSDSSGKVVRQISGRWRVDGGTMLLWTDDDRFLRRLFGQPTERTPVFLVGPDEFKLGAAEHASSFRRSPTTPENPP